MKTKDILELDCREEKNKKVIQKVLKSIKPLSKYSEEESIPIEALEKAMHIWSKKYGMRVRSIIPDIWANKKSDIWRCELVEEDTFELVGVVYGLTLYEIMAKTVVLVYSRIRKGEQ